VQDFVEFLQAKTNKDSRKKPRAIGSLKGKIQMTEDFDAPMDAWRTGSTIKINKERELNKVSN
jgi:hypothetical protein